MLKWTERFATTKTYDEGTKTYTDVPRPTYAGATLGVETREERVMSDVWDLVTYAQVWTGTEVVNVPVGYADLGGSHATVEVDATPDVLAAVATYRAAQKVEADRRAVRYQLERRLADAKRPVRGRHVVVTRGRKVPLGTTGEVFWFGETKFGPRVGFKTPAGEKLFTAQGNVTVTDPDVAALEAEWTALAA